MVELLFEDIFTLEALDPDGKKLDKVSRIEARSEQFDMYMQLDVNTEAYPLHVGDKFTMVLAPTLSLDGTPDSYLTQGGRESLADKFEYAMHGKLYKICGGFGSQCESGDLCFFWRPSDDVDGVPS